MYIPIPGPDNQQGQGEQAPVLTPQQQAVPESVQYNIPQQQVVQRDNSGNSNSEIPSGVLPDVPVNSEADMAKKNPLKGTNPAEFLDNQRQMRGQNLDAIDDEKKFNLQKQIEETNMYVQSAERSRALVQQAMVNSLSRTRKMYSKGISPGRVFSNWSNFRKALWIIASGASAYGSGGKNNMALAQLNRLMDADIAAQQFSLQQRRILSQQQFENDLKGIGTLQALNDKQYKAKMDRLSAIYVHLDMESKNQSARLTQDSELLHKKELIKKMYRDTNKKKLEDENKMYKRYLDISIKERDLSKKIGEEKSRESQGTLSNSVIVFNTRKDKEEYNKEAETLRKGLSSGVRFSNGLNELIGLLTIKNIPANIIGANRERIKEIISYLKSEFIQRALSNRELLGPGVLTEKDYQSLVQIIGGFSLSDEGILESTIKQKIWATLSASGKVFREALTRSTKKSLNKMKRLVPSGTEERKEIDIGLKEVITHEYDGVANLSRNVEIEDMADQPPEDQGSPLPRPGGDYSKGPVNPYGTDRPAPTPKKNPKPVTEKGKLTKEQQARQDDFIKRGILKPL